MHIHIDWTGPFSYDDALNLKNNQKDYGVYQIYGTHPIYGGGVLIYIGKADRQTFGLRLQQEQHWQFTADAAKLEVYVGRLAGYDGTPNSDEWSSQITTAERMLIVAHWPAGNSSGLNVILNEEYHDTHILNWGAHRSLLPEVSGSRYSNRYESGEGYATFEMPLDKA